MKGERGGKGKLVVFQKNLSLQEEGKRGFAKATKGGRSANLYRKKKVASF